jgi:hypothetical protein
MDEHETAYVWVGTEPISEYINGQRTDQDDSRTIKIGD